MVKAWFNKFDFKIEADIEYTNKGRPTEPYLSSFIVTLNGKYGGKYDEEITIRVFPPNDNMPVGYLNVEYMNKNEYVDGKSPIEYTGMPNFSSIGKIGKVFDHMDIPDYVKRVLEIIADYAYFYDHPYFYDNPLKILSAIKEIQNEIRDLSNTSGELPRVTQTVKIYGTVFDENDYGESLGKVNIDEYFTFNDETRYKVSHTSFEVQQTSDGELRAITDRRKKEFSPSPQEILDVIIPTRREFENLVQFVKDVIKKGKVEFSIKKGKVEFGQKNTY